MTSEHNWFGRLTYSSVLIKQRGRNNSGFSCKKSSTNVGWTSLSMCAHTGSPCLSGCMTTSVKMFQCDGAITADLQMLLAFNLYRPRSEGDNVLGSVRPFVCLSVRLSVCNQWAYADNCANAVDRLFLLHVKWPDFEPFSCFRFSCEVKLRTSKTETITAS